MDIFDQAQELEMLQRNASIEQARKAASGPVYTGECHYCGADLPSPRRFCDKDCLTGWEKEEAARKRNGDPAELEGEISEGDT